MGSPSNLNPPKWPMRFLRFFLKKEYLEEIEGDLEEIFGNNLEHHSISKAKRQYTWEVVKLLRPVLIKKIFGFHQLNQLGMFKNNLKIALRVFKSNVSYTLINILGLSTGLAIAMLIILYARFEMSYENYNPLADRMVRITMDYLNGESLVEQDCETYPPLGPRIVSEFSEVTNFARAYHIDSKTIKARDEYYRELKLYAVDPSFFTLFNYPMIHGKQETIFRNPHEAVLTESLALKYFDRTDVVGETLWMPWIDKTFKITGVIADSPPNTHLKFNMLISYATMKASFGEKDENWNGNNTFTYLLLSGKDKFGDFSKNLAELNNQLHKEEKILNERVIGQPVKDIHLYSDKPFEPEKNGDATSVFFLLGVAILVIIIAIVNYINLSTAKSLDRAKEVGIRKVIGSSTGQLRLQFFTESFLTNTISVIAALVFMGVFLEKFRNVADLPPSFTFLDDSMFWFLLVAILFLSTFISGIFPAFILSSFKPISVLKGKFSRSIKGAFLRKMLVIFQFSITIFLLIQTLTASEQLNFMRQKDLGVNIEQTIVVSAPQTNQHRKNYKTFKDQLLSHSQFQAVGLSTCVPGVPTHQMNTTTGINLAGVAERQNFNFYISFVDADFIPTIQIELIAGQNFVAESKNKAMVIVNEEAIKLWGIPEAEKAIGQKIDFWGEEASIIGVMKNFHQVSAKSAHIPIIFTFHNDFMELASIRTNPGNTKEQLETVRDIYHSNFPGSPFDYFFLDQEYDKQFRADEQFQQVFGILTGFAILIACMGLFGLASFAVAKRAKEIGIRKVLGASVSQVISLLSRDFMKLVLISVVISIPITYWIISYWLQRYAFRIDLGLWLFAGPAIALIVISFFTVFTKTFQVSTNNPIDTLRDE